MRQVFYYKMRRFYYKMRQLLQNVMFITNYDSTITIIILAHNFETQNGRLVSTWQFSAVSTAKQVMGHISTVGAETILIFKFK